jgi:hypothetical protein
MVFSLVIGEGIYETSWTTLGMGAITKFICFFPQSLEAPILGTLIISIFPLERIFTTIFYFRLIFQIFLFLEIFGQSVEHRL